MYKCHPKLSTHVFIQELTSKFFLTISDAFFTLFFQYFTMPKCSSSCGHTVEGRPELLRVGPLRPGDIIAIRASVYSPFYKFLAEEATGNFEGSSQVTSTFESVMSNLAGNAGKLRPGVIIDEFRRQHGKKITINLMATFEHGDTVPEVFRPFVAQISTRGTGGEIVHLHTSPEWPSSVRQWMITLPISRRKRNFEDQRWKSNTTKRTGYHFSQSTLDQVLEIHKAQKAAWNAKVKSDPGFLDQYRQELLDNYEVRPRVFISSKVFTSYLEPSGRSILRKHDCWLVYIPSYKDVKLVRFYAFLGSNSGGHCLLASKIGVECQHSHNPILLKLLYSGAC